MKKRSGYLISILIILLLITTISASIKTNRAIYTTKDPIYILSTVGVGDNLCRSQNPSETVKVYIVDHKANWKDQDIFEDVRGIYNEIPNEKFSNNRIWDNPLVGIYDLIVDCDEDLRYDEASEPIYSEGFEVVPKKGSASMTLGTYNPQNFEWQYDPENEILKKSMMQFQLVAFDENINLNEIKLQTKSPQEVNSIEIYFDKNNNGKIDTEDIQIGKDDSTQKEDSIKIDYQIRQEIEENFIIVINNKENTPKGDYQIKIVSITGTGIKSEEQVKFYGNPLESNIMKVIEKKTCLGELDLSFNPNPAELNNLTIATISGLKGCNDLKAILKSNECHLATGILGECTLEANECEIETPAVSGKYFACLDKNKNGNYNDFGESISTKLDIIGQPKTSNAPIQKIEESTNNNQEPAKITGNAINFSNLSLSNPLVVMVELTLLLILVLLAIILYKIIKPANKKAVEEDDSDLFEEKSKDDEIFENIEKKKKEITDKVEKDKKSSKSKTKDI